MNALPICVDLFRERSTKARGTRRILTGRNYRTPFVRASRNVAKLDSKLVSALFLTRRRFVIGVEQTARERIIAFAKQSGKTIGGEYEGHVVIADSPSPFAS